MIEGPPKSNKSKKSFILDADLGTMLRQLKEIKQVAGSTKFPPEFKKALVGKTQDILNDIHGRVERHQAKLDEKLKRGGGWSSADLDEMTSRSGSIARLNDLKRTAYGAANMLGGSGSGSGGGGGRTGAFFNAAANAMWGGRGVFGKTGAAFGALGHLSGNRTVGNVTTNMGMFAGNIIQGAMESGMSGRMQQIDPRLSIYARSGMGMGRRDIDKMLTSSMDKYGYYSGETLGITEGLTRQGRGAVDAADIVKRMHRGLGVDLGTGIGMAGAIREMGITSGTGKEQEKIVEKAIQAGVDSSDMTKLMEEQVKLMKTFGGQGGTPSAFMGAMTRLYTGDSGYFSTPGRIATTAAGLESTTKMPQNAMQMMVAQQMTGGPVDPFTALGLQRLSGSMTMSDLEKMPDSDIKTAAMKMFSKNPGVSSLGEIRDKAKRNLTMSLGNNNLSQAMWADEMFGITGISGTDDYMGGMNFLAGKTGGSLERKYPKNWMDNAVGQVMGTFDARARRGDAGIDLALEKASEPLIAIKTVIAEEFINALNSSEMDTNIERIREILEGWTQTFAKSQFNPLTSFMNSTPGKIMSNPIGYFTGWGSGSSGSGSGGTPGASGSWGSGASGNYGSGANLSGVKLSGNYAEDSGIGSFLKLIRYAEGTAGSKGYNTMFTGKTFDDLSKHPNIVNSGGGYKSTAAGAYQILKGTWEGISSQLGLTDFSAESQDKAGVGLMMRRLGVSSEEELESLLSAGLKDKKKFTQIMDALSPEWASLPTAATGTSYYGQGGKSIGQLWNAASDTSSTPSGIKAAQQAMTNSAVSTGLDSSKLYNNSSSNSQIVPYNSSNPSKTQFNAGSIPPMSTDGMLGGDPDLVNNCLQQMTSSINTMADKTAWYSVGATSTMIDTCNN